MKNKKRIIIISFISILLLTSIIVILSQHEYKGRNVKRVEKGCTYIIAATGEELKEGKKIPKPANGDIYKTKDYEYKYIADFNDENNTALDIFYAYTYYYEYTIKNGYDKKYETEGPLVGLSGWDHSTTNKDKEEYENIAGSIVGEPIIQVSFAECAKMKQSPKLPKSIVIMASTYRGCKSLASVPKIPKGVKLLWSTYSDCVNLTNPPKIPNGVIDMTGAFSGCKKLENAPEVPESVVCMSYTFADCTALKKVKKLPSDVVNISGLFEGCASIEEVPDIPDGVINMNSTFYNCTNLKTVKRIPSSVKKFTWTFRNCTSLTGIIEIETQTNVMWMCFSGVDFEKQNLELHGKKENIEYLLNSAYEK
ncbi:MAG: leucine-rich repeat protein [Lachnospiraceae bacterium]|nr:leucine-rich repeat protein [Lachnospiraceae bacterium]